MHFQNTVGTPRLKHSHITYAELFWESSFCWTPGEGRTKTCAERATVENSCCVQVLGLQPDAITRTALDGQSCQIIFLSISSLIGPMHYPCLPSYFFRLYDDSMENRFAETFTFAHVSRRLVYVQNSWRGLCFRASEWTTPKIWSSKSLNNFSPKSLNG